MTDERSLSPLQDRVAVIDVVLGFARALDVKDWAALERLKTLHLSANHLVTVDVERFDTYCAYTHALVRGASGWKIHKVKQTVYWNTGNPDIHTGGRR